MVLAVIQMVRYVYSVRCRVGFTHRDAGAALKD